MNIRQEVLSAIAQLSDEELSVLLDLAFSLKNRKNAVQPIQEIRDSFQKDLEELLVLEQALIAMTKFGEFSIQQHLQQYPNAEFPIYAREPSSPLPFKTSPLIKKLSEHIIIYNQHSGAIEEMIHTQLVQKWHDFLDNLFEHILNAHFSGISSSSYKKISGIQIKLDLSTDIAKNIITCIQENALQWFNFLKAEDKLKTIEKALNWQLPDTLKLAIKKHITVRNIFQHSNGILREDDLKRLGLQEITLLDDSVISRTFRKGDRLIVTYWELEAAKNDFYNAASLLVIP